MSAKASPKPGGRKTAASLGSPPEPGTTMSAKELAASKRQKKREVDRRCQREARQRTKARIAYLEELVEELRKQDTSGQVASLMEQVAQARNERDLFARTLRGIEDSIRGHRQLLENAEAAAGTKDSKVKGKTNPSDEKRDETVSPTSQGLSSATFPPPPTKATPKQPTQPAFGPTSPHFIEPKFPQANTPALVHSDAYGLAHPVPTEPIVAHKNGFCPHCDQLDDDQPHPQSTWQFANSILRGRPVLTPEELQWEDDCAEDTPVRAVVEGWKATTKRLGGTLPPLWRALRQIDEKVFPDVQPVERLAILRIMHMLYRFHAGAGLQKTKLPSWYMARPSQAMQHSYAIDFFTWPGLRERMVFSEHSYCSDLFWHYQNKSLRILWQYDFRDCYTMNRQTGSYEVSKSFDARIADITSWTMGTDFFEQWPELYADVPNYESTVLPMTRLELKSPALKQMQRERVGSARMLSSAPTTGMLRQRPFGSGIIDMDGADIGHLTAGRISGYQDYESDDDMDGDSDAAEQEQRRRASFVMQQQALQDAASNNMVFQSNASSTIQDLTRARGMGIIPQHDWIWMQPVLDDGGMGDEQD